MGKYYCLIAGLPTINPEDTKLAYSVSEFKTEIDPMLSNADKRLMQWILLKYDNANLLAHLRKQPHSPFDDRACLTRQELKDVCGLVKDGDQLPEALPVPPYFVRFIEEYYVESEGWEDGPVSWDDRLSALYYEEAMKCGNGFLKSWFEMNLDIGNLMTAINCRKYGLDKNAYIIGNNELAEQLRQSSLREGGLDHANDYMEEIQRIADVPDIIVRERKLDVMRWNWLEENTFFKTFDIESVISYLLRLSLIERWARLDKASGDKTFRELISGMKESSIDILEEFKKNIK